MSRAPLSRLLLALTMISPLEAASDPEVTVAVRTYNYAQIAVQDLVDARATATAIFADAGISIEWIDCRVMQSKFGSACTGPLNERGDLLLRLVDHAPPGSANATRVVALGTSMLDREQRRGVIMDVNVFPIRAIAETASTDVRTLLGRAIAHEIGHLLLGTPDHSKDGLMRAHWSQNELRGMMPASWRFSPREAAQMRNGLALGILR
jgi:hypothetical protein